MSSFAIYYRINLSVFFHVRNISVVITDGVFKRVETDSGLT